MEELPETLKEEIEALDSLDARALRRRYAASSSHSVVSFERDWP